MGGWYGIASDSSGMLLAAAQLMDIGVNKLTYAPGYIYTSTSGIILWLKIIYSSSSFLSIGGSKWIKTSAPASYWGSIVSDASGMRLAVIPAIIVNVVNTGSLYVSTSGYSFM